MNKNSLDRSPFDHLLATMGGVFATYSLGVSVNRPVLAQALAIAVIVASLIGLVLGRVFRNSPIIKMDGWFLGFLGLAAAFTTPLINGILPDEGLPLNLMVGTTLSAIVVLGSLVAWRDGTMLFLSLPSVALFGLVGVFDAWKPSIALFFLFLIAIAVLYARAYLRSQMEKARSMGADPMLLRRDVWRWVAGPEWAFASAGIVVLLSPIIGFLLQFSLSPVAGAVRISAPSQSQNRNISSSTSPNEVNVGRGRVTLSETPVFKLKMDEPRFVRRFVYYRYANSGWSTYYPDVSSTQMALKNQATDATHTIISNTKPSSFEPIDKPVSIDLTYAPVSHSDSVLPTPGVVTEVDAPSALVQVSDTKANSTLVYTLGEVSYKVDVPGEMPGNRTAMLPGAYPNAWRGMMREGIPDRVSELAHEVTKDDKTDYKRCLDIIKELGNRCQYTTDAPVYDPNRDVVDQFLFEKKLAYCDVFTTAFVEMARSIGIPARYASGYLIRDIMPGSDGYFTVKEKDSHAWAEVYFDGIGWYPLDTVATAVDISPKDNGSNKLAGINQQTIWTTIAQIIGGLALVAGLVFGFIKGKSLLHDRRTSTTVVIDLQNKFQLAIEKVTGRPRRFSQSIREYVAISGPALAECIDPCLDLAANFEQAMFSSAPVTRETVDKLKAQNDAVVTQLRELAKAKK